MSFNAGLLQSPIIPEGIQGKDVDELSSSNSTSCSSEKDYLQSCSLYSSPEDGHIEISDDSVYSPVDLQGKLLYYSESGHNFSFLPKNNRDPTSGNQSTVKSRSHREQIIGERDKSTVPLQGFTAFGSLKTGQNVRATLTYAALAAVMENDEPASHPAQWFDTADENKSRKVRRASTGSLDNNLLYSETEKVLNNGVLEPSNLETINTGSCGKNSSSPIESVTEYQMRKAIGHSRSRSDQLGVTKFQKHEFFIDVSKSGGNEKENSFSDVSRLSSSLPTTSGTNLKRFDCNLSPQTAYFYQDH